MNRSSLSFLVACIFETEAPIFGAYKRATTATMSTPELIELVEQLNKELYGTNEYKFGGVEFRTDGYCESISIAGHCIWDCNHPGAGSEEVSTEQLIRDEVREFCRFFGEALYRIKDTEVEG